MTSKILDVAALAGVSAKTVSRVVNDEPGVSESTRRKVLEAVARLDYSPDRAATYLRTGRSGVIGLAVPELGQPFFAELADRIATTAARHHLSVVLGVTGQHGEAEEDFLNRHVELDGVILYWQGLGPQRLSTEARRRPIVILGENKHDDVDRVTMGNDLGVRLALAHLLALGRERIAVIGMPRPARPATVPPAHAPKPFAAQPPSWAWSLTRVSSSPQTSGAVPRERQRCAISLTRDAASTLSWRSTTAWRSEPCTSSTVRASMSRTRSP